MQMMRDASPPLVAARQLLGERAGLRLWGPLDLMLAGGDAVHVLGPNGCGKTTLLRTLAGLRPPARGRVGLHAPAWFVGHATPLADDLGPLDNLQAWLGLHDARPETRTAITDWLTSWGLPRHRAVRELSAGQRRKIALAPLWLAPRRLWLLDEPFDALDTEACTALAGLARTHLASGGAILLSSHQALPATFPPCTALDLRASRPVAAEAR